MKKLLFLFLFVTLANAQTPVSTPVYFNGVVTAGCALIYSSNPPFVFTCEPVPVIPVPVASGGTGTASTLTGLVRGNSSAMTAAELSGDTTTSGSNVATIATAAVTLAKMADIATARLIGRTTAGTGVPEALSILPTALVPAFTGDVTNSAGSLATTIATKAVTLAKMDDLATARIIGRNTAGTGVPESLATLPTGTMPALTGDITTPGGSLATTLATVASAGTTGSSTAIPVITINVKGLTTTITTAAVVAPAGTLTGGTLASGVLASSLTSVGTLASPALTTPVINHPTIGISGTSASSHVLTVGSAPTCAFTSGGGTSPSCALQTGSTDHAGTMILSTGSGAPGSAGTITLTFNGTMGTNSPVCVVSLTKGAVDWSVSSTVRMTTFSTTAPVFTWNSQSATALVALTASTAGYDISYICYAK